jgi:hypothetical protein
LSVILLQIATDRRSCVPFDKNRPAKLGGILQARDHATECRNVVFTSREGMFRLDFDDLAVSSNYSNVIARYWFRMAQTEWLGTTAHPIRQSLF